MLLLMSPLNLSTYGYNHAVCHPGYDRILSNSKFSHVQSYNMGNGCGDSVLHDCWIPWVRIIWSI